MTTSTTTGSEVGRYATLGGGPVVVTRYGDEAYAEEGHDCRWRCLCGEGIRWLDSEEDCRDAADRHAGQCRVAQKPVVDPSTAAVLAELTGVRADLGRVAAAMEGLRAAVATIAKAAVPLACLPEVVQVIRDLPESFPDHGKQLDDIAEAIADLPDYGDVLSDIATAVERRRRGFWQQRKTRVFDADERHGQAQAEVEDERSPEDEAAPRSHSRP